MPVVDELVTLLGVDLDPAAAGKAKTFGEKLGTVRRTAVALGLSLVALDGVVGTMVKRFAAAADESGKFAKSVDINLRKLKELEYATKRVGGSSDELRSDLAGLADQFGSAERGIDSLIDRFNGLTDQEARLAGKSFGLSESTIRLLRAGSEEIASLREEFRQLGGGLPKDAAKRAAEFNVEWLRLTTTINGISGTVQVALLPAFSGASQALRKFLIDNRALISSGLEIFLIGVREGLGQFKDLVERVSSSVVPLVSGLDDLTGGLEYTDVIANVVVGTLVALAIALTPLAVKLAIIGAAVLAVGLAIDDLVTYIKGGDSAIGRFFDAFAERYPELTALIKSMRGAFGEFFDYTKEGWRLVLELFEAGEDSTLGRFFAYLSERFPAITKLVKTVGGTFEWLFLMVGEGWKLIFEGLSKITKLLPDFSGFAEGVLGLLEKGAQFLGFGDGGNGQMSLAPEAQVPAGVVNNVANNNQGGSVTNTFNISGAGDPRAVAAEVHRRGGAGMTGQTMSPGQRAPRTG